MDFDFTYYCDNKWFLWIAINFTILIGMVSGTIYKVLDLIAYYHPDVPTNLIKDLFKTWLTKPTVPGDTCPTDANEQ
jgi:hypothetical protein